MPSFAENELKLLAKEIKELKAKLLVLKKKKKRKELNSDEEVDFEEFEGDLEDLKEDKNFWQRIIEKAAENASVVS